MKTRNIIYVTDATNPSVFFTVSISPSLPLWGSQFSISCKVSPGAPGAAFEWALNNSSAIEGVEISQTDAADSAVRGVASTSLEGTWSCVVGYKGQVGRASAALTLKGSILTAGV